MGRHSGRNKQAAFFKRMLDSAAEPEEAEGILSGFGTGNDDEVFDLSE